MKFGTYHMATAEVLTFHEMPLMSLEGSWAASWIFDVCVAACDGQNLQASSFWLSLYPTEKGDKVM